MSALLQSGGCKTSARPASDRITTAVQAAIISRDHFHERPQVTNFYYCMMVGRLVGPPEDGNVEL